MLYGEPLVLVPPDVSENINTRPFVNELRKIAQNKLIRHPDEVLLSESLGLIYLNDRRLSEIERLRSAIFLIDQSFK